MTHDSRPQTSKTLVRGCWEPLAMMPLVETTFEAILDQVECEFEPAEDILKQLCKT